MRKVKLSTLFILMVIGLKAQDRHPALTVGYFAPFGFHVGGKIGTEFSLKNLDSTEGKYQRQLVLRPQVGYSSNIRVKSDFLTTVELGFKNLGEKGKFYHLPSIGIGYVRSSFLVDGAVNLGTGDITRRRESSGSMLPSISYEMGRVSTRKVSYYFKAFYGKKVLSEAESSGFFGLDIGLNLFYSKKEK